VYDAPNFEEERDFPQSAKLKSLHYQFQERIRRVIEFGANFKFLASASRIISYNKPLSAAYDQQAPVQSQPAQNKHPELARGEEPVLNAVH